MTGEREARFRLRAAQLDSVMLRDETAICAAGVAIHNWSERQYHHKCPYLAWEYWFESARPRGNEVEKVTVLLAMRERDADHIEVRTRSEIFQIGKLSRWQARTERVVKVEALVQYGLASFVLQAIAEGHTAAACAA